MIESRKAQWMQRVKRLAERKEGRRERGHVGGRGRVPRKL